MPRAGDGKASNLSGSGAQVKRREIVSGSRGKTAENQEYMRSVGSSGCGSAGLLLPTVIAHDAIMIASANRNTARAIVLTMTTTPEFNGRIAEARRWRNTSLIFG